MTVPTAETRHQFHSLYQKATSNLFCLRVKRFVPAIQSMLVLHRSEQTLHNVAIVFFSVHNTDFPARPNSPGENRTSYSNINPISIS